MTGTDKIKSFSPGSKDNGDSGSLQSKQRPLGNKGVEEERDFFSERVEGRIRSGTQAIGTQIAAQCGGKLWSCQSSLGIAIGKVVIWRDIGGGTTVCQ